MRRRTQVGLASVGLTLLCAAGLYAVFVGGKVGQYLRAVAKMAAVGASLEAVAVVWSGLPMNDRTPDLLNELEFSNFLLLPSMVALLASSVLYFARFFSGRASRARFEPQ